MEMQTVLDKLDSLLATSAKVPGLNRVIVDVDKAQELIDQLRLAVPRDVKAAQEILARKDALSTQAQHDARRIKHEAEEEYRTRLDNNEIVKSARRRADEVMEDATKRAQRMMEQATAEVKSRLSEADAYSVETLRRVEKQLGMLLGQVRRGLETLEPESVDEEEKTPARAAR